MEVMFPPEDNAVFRLARWVGLLPSNLESRRVAQIEFLNDRQADEHNRRDTLFFYVKMGRLSSVKLLLDGIKDDEKRRAKVKERDFQGANAIHVAYLYGRYEVAHYLVEMFPEAGILPYGRERRVGGRSIELPYAGETVLHMCIVSKNFDEVRWLLEFYRQRIYSLRKSHNDSALRQLLQTQVTGDFFRIGRPTYFGETPLHFAACTNDPEMFDLVLAYTTEEFPRALFSLDRHGNNLLHICVLRELKKMYKHVLETARRELENIIRNLLSAYLEKPYATWSK